MSHRFLLSVFTIIVSLSNGAVFAAVGRTAGQFNVSQVGAATYSIPIWGPPGPHGLKPHISLVYNSQSGDGPLGVGWSLSGISSIYRCPSTYAQDGTPGPITLAYTDRFCLDGKRLRLTSSGSLSTYGESGTTYQTEIADFSSVIAQGATGNGPTYFTVQLRNGLTYEYGNGGNPQVQQSGTATAWYLDKINDRSGNTITISYLEPSLNLTGSTVPSLISWGPGNSMSFNYTASTVPSKTGSVAGGTYSNLESLGNITVAVGATTVKTYVLTYTASATTNRETLTTVQECGGSAGTNCLAATTVGYQNGTAGVAAPSTSTGSGVTNATVFSVGIDGDGRQDLVFSTWSGSNYQWWVQLATATGYASPVDTGAVTADPTTLLLDDFDASGETEILAPVSGIWYV